MSPEAVEELRTRAALALGIRDLRLSLDESWSPGRGGVGHRKALRERIATELASTSQAQLKASILDLSSPPRHPERSISVSHCPTLGGYASVPLPLWIGFDIEVASRVTPSLVERVRTAGDGHAPSAPLLWAAKEAVFKCLLLGQQPTTLTQITVPTWVRGAHGEFSFTAQASEPSMMIDGYGAAFESGSWVLCFFADHSQKSRSPTDNFNSTLE